jgi:carboxypeptidase Taq
MTSYERLAARFSRLNDLNGALAVLHWDSAVMMPSGGAAARADQIATLTMACHDLMTEAGLDDALSEAESEVASLDDDWHRANIGEMRRLWRHANCLPADLVEALSQASSASEMLWREAREANDFDLLAPKFAATLDLVRQVAAVKSEALGVAPYDALLDQYDPGTTSAEIDPLFEDLGAFLPGFLAQVRERQAQECRDFAAPPLPLPGPFAIDDQRQLGLRLMATLGFDFNFGRLDISHHPFTGGIPDDVRITTRYVEDDFTQSLMGVLHETGHALYERGLPAAWRSQPVGLARGMTLHESQSLIIEMLACRSAPFIAWLAPLARRAFAGDGPAWTAENMTRLNLRVEPGLIRVEADEVTYPLHVLLRYRLEKAMIAGDLSIKDLPGAWRDGMGSMLGVTPPDDRDGCLQDIHWPGGDFGYFPTYTLGAMAAAQFFDAATRADDGVMAGLATGDFAPLTSWLKTNVHSVGSLKSTQAIITQATGRPLDVATYKRHLQRRYLPD